MAFDEFVPEESLESDLPEYSYESTIITFDEEEYEYVRKYATLEDPSDINNLAIDKIYVIDQIYSPVGIFTDLTVNRDLYLYRFLYDKDEFKGTPGQVLLSDASGIRWGEVSSANPPLQAIDIYDEGIYAGTVSRLDFYDGSDQNNLVRATVSIASTSVGRITISDRWSVTGPDIYRVSKVGINTIPNYDLDVVGDVNISLKLFVGDDTDIVGKLNVDDSTTLGSTLDVDGSVRFNDITQSTSKDTGSLVVEGGVGIEKNINIGGNAQIVGFTTINSTASSISPTTGALQVKGGAGIGENLNIDKDLNVNRNLNVVGFSTFGNVATLNTGIVPDSADGAYLGTPSLPFSEAHIGDIRIADSTSNTIDTSSGDLVLDSASGTVNVQDDLDVDQNLNVVGFSTFGNVATLNTGIVPDSSNGAYLGTPSLPFSESYIGNVRIADSTSNTIDTSSGNLILDSTSGTVNVQDNLDVDQNLNVDGTAKIVGTLELDNALIDVNGSTATGKRDYRLASVGTGVSWRPPGVETQNAIWVTMDGNDSNSGYLEGDAKRTIGAASAIAEPGDTIFIRSGVYYENNPIGLRTDVSVSGQDLRLVTIVPNNPTKDVFHVRRGCLIENLNFAGQNITTNHPGCGAVAFPPTSPVDYAVTGYIAPGPTDEGPSGRWRSPYIRNCTNFMTGSIGMKINGDHAVSSTIGADLKCMVCDSFTQYNENGIGVSITNNGYAQLVSIFTINCDIGIYADTGGSCDLTNSNSSFGNFGLVAVGLGRVEFTGKVLSDTPGESDIVGLSSVFDSSNDPRRPYDGQALWFKINLDNYPDAEGSGVISQPLQQLDSITVTNGGSGYSSSAPPSVLIVDLNDLTQSPKGPQGIIAEASPTIDDITGSIVGIDVINSGRNYLSAQNIGVIIVGDGGATATANMSPIYYTVSAATEPSPTGITTVTFNEFVPYELFANDLIELRRISRILTSSHSFEYIGTGTDINTATPFKGGVPIKANEVVARDGAQIPFTSTDQKGNFDIGEGIQIDQTTNTIRGRDFSRAIQAEVTPLILALR